jgi:hypothetical protein
MIPAIITSARLKGIAKISNFIGNTCKLNIVIHIIKNEDNQARIIISLKENF